MIRILLHGCCGHMGREVSATALADAGTEIVAGVDRTAGPADYPVYADFSKLTKESADVLIDFSVAAAVDAVLDFAERTGMPAVICTTGLSEAQLTRIAALQEKVAILRSANMSLGVNLLMKLAAEAANVLAAKGFDIEIVEKHHRRKVDAPSGTALAIADEINAACDELFHYVYDRESRHTAREQDEIGISAVRGGTIPGDHDVIYAGDDEVLTLSHRAYSRRIFSQGAVEAAKFLAGQKPGRYTMADVIAASLQG